MGAGTPWHGQVLFGRERLKRSILVHIYLTKSLLLSLARASSFLAGTGILRNPQESSGIRSKYRNSCPPGIEEEQY
jgi:hypothetical protein